jgi:teichuronic acid biosynthesis glycosyltransferase TuaC
MPLWVNAADVVLVTSEYEGFGLLALESLACDVPVVSTPVGIAPFALKGIPGCLAAPFEVEAWLAALRPHLEAPDPRVRGRQRAASFAAERMGDRVVVAYLELLDGDAAGAGR